QHDDEGLLRGEKAERWPDRFRRKRFRHRAAPGFGARQPQHGGQPYLGHPCSVDRHAPAVVLVDIAANEIAEEYAKISTDGIDAERAGALVLVEEVGDQRLRGGGAGGFTDANANSGQCQRRDAGGHAAEERHGAPEPERACVYVSAWWPRG